MNGFLNINKPSGISSYDVIRRLKPVLQGVKMGHLGTLDPMAEGVLPLALGWATRLIEYITDDTKAYQAEIKLGGVSNTQDRTGSITQEACRMPDADEIKAALARFEGEIQQIPPQFSAVHYQGQRLYQYARRGEKVEVEPRSITIYQLSLLEVVFENEEPLIRVSVECSPGTYVRTLAHDLGQVLGCGGYLNHLVRTRSGPFRLEEAYDLQNLVGDQTRLVEGLLPPEFPLSNMARITLNDTEAWMIQQGQTLKKPGLSIDEIDRPCLVYDDNGNLLAVARGILNKEEGSLLRPEKVWVRGERQKSKTWK